MKITTKYVTNTAGTGQIRATGNGKQRTINYDHAASVDANHGAAAGELALVLFQSPGSRAMAAKHAKHIAKANGTHTFTFI